MARLQLNGRTWTFRKAISRIGEIYREDGIKGLGIKILGETVYRRAVLLERFLDEPIIEATAKIPLDICLVNRTESPEYLNFRKGTDAQEVRRRLNAGHWYASARYEGRLVYTRWVGVGKVWEFYFDCKFDLAHDEVYIYDLYVAPEFRGKNIATAVASQVYQHLRDAGYRRIVTTILPDNKASLRLAEKGGFRVVGLMGYYKIGPWRRAFHPTGAGSPPSPKPRRSS